MLKISSKHGIKTELNLQKTVDGIDNGFSDLANVYFTNIQNKAEQNRDRNNLKNATNNNLKKSSIIANYLRKSEAFVKKKERLCNKGIISLDAFKSIYKQVLLDTQQLLNEQELAIQQINGGAQIIQQANKVTQSIQQANERARAIQQARRKTIVIPQTNGGAQIIQQPHKKTLVNATKTTKMFNQQAQDNSCDKFHPR